MTLQVQSFNIWAVLVSLLCQMVLGALWYSPVLFGNIWLRLTGQKAEDISKEDASRSMMISIVPSLILVFSLALVVAFVNASTIIDALIIGSVVSIGFIGTISFNLVLFESRPVKLFLLNAGYPFVSLNICAVILTMWK